MRLVALLLALALPATASTPTLAVAYFDNNSGSAEFDPLRKGLADMLITDLVNCSNLRVVERDRLNAVIDELKLGQSKLVDKTSAVKMGKLLSAQFVLTGGMIVSKDTLRIDARVINVESGSAVSAQRVDGPLADFFAVEKDLVDALLKDLLIKVLPEERSKLRRNQTQSYQAFNNYSQGLDAKDQGRDAAAAKLFEKAFEADPGFVAAKNQLERITALLKAARKEQLGEMSSAAGSLNPKSPDFGDRVQEVLMATLVSKDEHAMAEGISVLRLLVEKDLYPSCGTGLNAFSPEALWLSTFAMNYYWDPETVELITPVFEYLLRKYPRDRMISSSNLADSPRQLAKQVELKKTNPELLKSTWSSLEYLAPFRANQKAARELLLLVKAKVPARK